MKIIEKTILISIGLWILLILGYNFREHIIRGSWYMAETRLIHLKVLEDTTKYRDYNVYEILSDSFDHFIIEDAYLYEKVYIDSNTFWFRANANNNFLTGNRLRSYCLDEFDKIHFNFNGASIETYDECLELQTLHPQPLERYIIDK